jgi:hypothetical protein
MSNACSHVAQTHCLRLGIGGKKPSFESRKCLVAAASLTNEKILHEIRFGFLEDRNATSPARPVTLKRFAWKTQTLEAMAAFKRNSEFKKSP